MSTITVDAVADALVAYLVPVVGPGVAIVRGAVNRVPLPLGDSIVLRDVVRVPLETPVAKYDATLNTVTFTEPMRIDWQLDFYGPRAADLSHAVQTTFRSWYAVEHFPDYIKPLYVQDAARSPLASGEEQYIDRWLFTVSIQYNGDIVLTQEHFNTLGSTECIPADVFYQ